MSLSGNRIYLFDTSIWDYTKHPLVASDWDAALECNQLAVSPIVVFEVLYGAQNQADFEALERQMDALRQAPLTRGIVRDARRALHDLSVRANHRLPFQDALIAATAAHRNMTVLHYDGHFDVLSRVLGFEGRWAAGGRGSGKGGDQSWWCGEWGSVEGIGGIRWRRSRPGPSPQAQAWEATPMPHPRIGHSGQK